MGEISGEASSAVSSRLDCRLPRWTPPSFLPGLPNKAKCVDQIVDMGPGEVERTGRGGDVPVDRLERTTDEVCLEPARLLLERERSSFLRRAVGGRWEH